MAKGKKNGSGGKAASSSSSGATSTPNPPKPQGASQAERLARYRLALERGQTGGLPSSTAFDDLLASPPKGKGKNPDLNVEGENPDIMSTDNPASDGEPVTDSVGGGSASVAAPVTPGGLPDVSGATGSGGPGSAPSSGKPAMDPAATGSGIRASPGCK